LREHFRYSCIIGMITTKGNASASRISNSLGRIMNGSGQ
jgi:hypothetical protein